MRYLSVCSGIEAASVAWEPLGWTPAAFAEIETFPSQVLAHRFGSNMPGKALSHNAPPNLGDMTKFQEWPNHAIDLLVGGTPCQSFSVAGLRKGLADPRGNLALTYLGIADRYRPKWVLWENVPGVLSSNGGRDFGSFLGALVQLGYGFAYRVLDAQYVRIDGFGRAVPQRRRRVFVVGCSAGWRHAAAVLFDGASLRGDSAPGRKAGKAVAPTLSSRTKGGGGLGTDFDCDGGLVYHDAAHCLNAGGMARLDYETESFVVAPQIARTLTRGAESFGKGGYAGRRQEDDDNLVAHALRAEGFDASEDGTGRGAPIVPVAFTTSGYGAEISDVASTMQASFDRLSNQVYGCIERRKDQWAVRRLTPTECERLQGFPDDWTDIARPNGKQAADGPRYKALGNSMAVNVMRWIGRRIEMVESVNEARRAIA